MNKIKIIAASFALLASLAVNAQDRTGAKAGKDEKKAFSYTWSRSRIDGSRTGVTSPSAENWEKALGTVKGKTYHSPSGKTFKGGTVSDVAEIVFAAQPAMAPVKRVVGYSPEAMVRSYPECALSNLFIDTVMAATEKASGRKVDIGVANFGGIRVDMPKGEILEDDIMSMFPFKNTIVYVSLKGKDIRAFLESMAAGRFQVLGGVRVVAEGGRLVSAEIGGEPIDDERVYGLATISFLLNGGDDLFLARNAIEILEFPEADIYDVIMAYIEGETAAGRPVVYKADGRVQIR